VRFLRKNLIQFFILFVFFCFFSSCTEWSSGYVPIKGKIFFKVVEGHREPYCDCEPEIILSMWTEEIFGCCNFHIESEMLRMGNNITINLLGIYMPSVCLTALGPASSSEFLDLPEGVYSLNFVHRFDLDRYDLIVSDSSLEVIRKNARFTEPEVEVFWRYPPNSFVYFCGTLTETSWICQDFLNILLSEVNLQEIYFPDFGEACYPRSSMGHYYDMPARYFLYESEEDFDRAGEVLEAYTHAVIENYSGVSLSFMNWKDKHYASWLFD